MNHLKPLYYLSAVMAVSSSCAFCMVCDDVISMIKDRALKVSLSTEFERYVPGELVSLKLIFENTGHVPVAVPNSAADLFDEIEQFNLERGSSSNSLAWQSNTSRTSQDRPIDRCKTTLSPKVLLKGDVLQLKLSNVEAWKESRIRENFVHVAGLPGKRKTVVRSGDFELAAEYEVSEIMSSEVRCIAYDLESSSTKKCRQVALVKTKNDVVVLVSTILSPPMAEAQFRSYLDTLERRNRSQQHAHFSGSERVLSSSDDLAFLTKGVVLNLQDEKLNLVKGADKSIAVDLRGFKLGARGMIPAKQ